MQLGSFQFDNPIALAPMAGVTDRPFRLLCENHGAAFAIAEMVSANPVLAASPVSRRRLDMAGIRGPRIIQIVGADPQHLMELARRCEAEGADVVDINMGCPAKTICSRQAGAALLGDEQLVARIIAGVVSAVRIPVTVKMRTGLDPTRRNAVQIAGIAEQEGARMLSVHGRTRACGYRGEAEYDTIAAIKSRVSIPVLANGDIDSPGKAAAVLSRTGADGLLIGRAARGNPWLFSSINEHLRNSREPIPVPSRMDVLATMHAHAVAIHHFYGDRIGVQIAKQHIAAYLRHLPDGRDQRPALLLTRNAVEQGQALQSLLDWQAEAA